MGNRQMFNEGQSCIRPGMQPTCTFIKLLQHTALKNIRRAEHVQKREQAFWVLEHIDVTSRRAWSHKEELSIKCMSKENQC